MGKKKARFLRAWRQKKTDSVENLNQRLQRYAGAKSRALDMANYIKTEDVSNNENRKLVKKLGDCASYLVFKHYYTENKVILHGMKTCRQQLLCPFCALRRAAKHVRAYWNKVATVKAENPDLQLYFVTLTVKDGESLQERFSHLVTAERRYKQKRLNALKGQKFVEYAKAQGGVCSVEFKRGQNSGQWHPHMHMIWLCSEAPDAHQLSREWEALTGDSFIVDVRPMYGEIDGFLETFKYALKFSDLELSDNLHAYKTLKGKRLINSFGALREVEIPEELTDDDLDDDLPYMLMLYTYRKGQATIFPSNGQRTYHEILHQKRQRLLACTGQRLYPKPKRSLCFHSRPNVAVCFQSGRLHAPQTVLNTLKGYSLHFSVQSRS